VALKMKNSRKRTNYLDVIPLQRNPKEYFAEIQETKFSHAETMYYRIPFLGDQIKKFIPENGLLTQICTCQELFERDFV
jgi:hypothetical protein